MPLVIIEHNKNSILNALAGDFSLRHGLYLDLIKEIYDAVKIELVHYVDAKEKDLAMSAPEFPLISLGRLPIEIVVVTTSNQYWRAPGRTQTISEAITKAASNVLQKWHNEKKADFADWQLCFNPLFIPVFCMSNKIG